MVQWNLPACRNCVHPFQPFWFVHLSIQDEDLLLNESEAEEDMYEEDHLVLPLAFSVRLVCTVSYPRGVNMWLPVCHLKLVWVNGALFHLFEVWTYVAANNKLALRQSLPIPMTHAFKVLNEDSLHKALPLPVIIISINCAFRV